MSATGRLRADVGISVGSMRDPCDSAKSETPPRTVTERMLTRRVAMNLLQDLRICDGRGYIEVSD